MEVPEEENMLTKPYPDKQRDKMLEGTMKRGI